MFLLSRAGNSQTHLHFALSTEPLCPILVSFICLSQPASFFLSPLLDYCPSRPLKYLASGPSTQPVPILLFLLHPLLADTWFSQFLPHSPSPKAYTPPLSIFMQPSQIIPCSDSLHPNLASITLNHKLLTPVLGFPLVSKLFYPILLSIPQASLIFILLTWSYLQILPSLHSASLSLSTPFLLTEPALLSSVLETAFLSVVSGWPLKAQKKRALGLSGPVEPGPGHIRAYIMGKTGLLSCGHMWEWALTGCGVSTCIF